MLTHTKPMLRKKTAALFFKIFYVHPEALTTHFERLAERLADDN